MLLGQFYCGYIFFKNVTNFISDRLNESYTEYNIINRLKNQHFLEYSLNFKISIKYVHQFPMEIK